MRRSLSVLAAIAIFAVMPGCKSADEIAKEKAATEKDMKALDGRWTLSSMAAEADDVSEEDKDKPKAFEVQIKDGVIKRVSSGNVFQRDKMTIYPLKEPKQIDLVLVKEDGTPEQRKYSVRIRGKKGKPDKWETRTGQYKTVGVYKLDGDNLELCVSYDEKERPTEISSGPGRYVMKLVRIKAGDKEPEKKDDKKEPEKKDDKKEPEKKDDKKKDGE